MIGELECLEFQIIIGFYGSRLLKIYFLDLLSRVHIFKNLIEYLGWRMFVFKCCITENFNFKVIQFCCYIMVCAV